MENNLNFFEWKFLFVLAGEEEGEEGEEEAGEVEGEGEEGA